MAAKKSKASAEAKAASTWTPEVKPETGDDLELAASFNVKFGTVVATIRSLLGLAGFSMSGGSEINAGAATAGPENVAVKLGTGTVTWTGSLFLVGSQEAVPQQIWLGGHVLGAKIVFSGTGKWVLKEAMKCAGSWMLEAGKLTTSSQEVQTAYAQMLGGSLDPTGSTFVCNGTGTGEGWHCASGVTVTATVLAVELTDEGATEKQFYGGGKTYGTVTLRSWTKLETSSTFTLLNVFNKSTLAGKGVHVVQGTTQTCTAISFNGTEANPSRLESAEPGKRWKLVLPAGGYQPANSFGLIKDVEATEAAPLYVPNAAAIENCLFVFKEAKPTVFKDTATGTATAAASSTERLVFTGTITSTGTSTGAATSSQTCTDSSTGTASSQGTQSSVHAFADHTTGIATPTISSSSTHAYADTHVGSVSTSAPAISTQAYLDASPAAGTPSGSSTAGYAFNDRAIATGSASASAVEFWHQGPPPKPCRIQIANRPAVILTISNRKAVSLSIENRKGVLIGTENE